MLAPKDITALIDDSYMELNKIKAGINIHETSAIIRFNLLAIEIALSLFQLGIFNKREITEQEENWFKGGYYIHYSLDGGWGKLANNYSMIVEIVQNHNFFR